MTYSVKAGCLVADPPWQHSSKADGKKHRGGAVKHYSTMTTPDICRMVIPPLADDCWLFLWRLHTHHEDALQVAAAWGFTRPPSSEFVWVKMTNDSSRPRMGTGFGTRMAHEVCLIFKRGKPERADLGVCSAILEPRGEHSAKPAEFYRRVDRLVGAVPRVELFARRQWPNWRCFGNEMPEKAAE